MRSTRTRSRRGWRSGRGPRTSPRLAIRTGRARAHAQRGPAAVVSAAVVRRARRLGQQPGVPCLDPHLVEHRDHVLGGDVACRAGRYRTAAELAEARLERVDAGLQRGEDVGQALAAGVVEVGGQLDVGRSAGAPRGRLATCADWPSGGVAEASRRAGGAGRRRSNRLDGTAPRRTAEAGADHGLTTQAGRAGAPDHADRPSDSSTERLTLWRLCDSEADRNTLISSNRSRS